MVARTGFEPVTSALRGRCPKPLDERGVSACLNSGIALLPASLRRVLAGMEGVEPSLTEPESAVLPLDDIPVLVANRTGGKRELIPYQTSMLSATMSERFHCFKSINIQPNTIKIAFR